MPTSAFLSKIDSTTRSPVTIVVLELQATGTNPAKTIYFSDREYVDPNGVPYNALLLQSPNVDQGGEFLGHSWRPVDVDLVFRDDRLLDQQIGERFSKYLASNSVVGSKLSIWHSDTTLTTMADREPFFVGEVSDVLDAGRGEIRLRAVQGRKWVTPFPTRKVDRGIYPNAAKDVVGTTIPIIYGNFSAGRYIYNPAPGITVRTYQVGIARAVLPLICVDTGAWGSDPKFILCGHPLQQAANEALLIFDDESDRYVGTAYVSTSQSASETTIQLLPANYAKFKAAIRPNDKNATNTADNWLEPIREDKDVLLTGYADLDHSASKILASYIFPDISPKGTFVSASIEAYYAKNASGSPHPQLGVFRNGLGELDTTVDLTATSDIFPSNTPRNRTTLAPGNKILGWEHFKDVTIYVTTMAAGQRLNLHWILVVVEYVPERTVIKPGKKVQGEAPYTVGGRKNRGYTDPSPKYGERPTSTVGDITAFDKPAGTYQVGHGDDESGTYTGTPNGLISHPADIAHHALRNYCGAAANEITLGSNFGSFVSIRSSLPSYKCHAFLAEAKDSDAFIEDLQHQFFFWMFRSTIEANGAWRAVPWKIGVAPNYRWGGSTFVFDRNWIVQDSLRAGLTPISKIRNVIRVSFDYDIRTRTYLGQSYVSLDEALAPSSRGWSSVHGDERREQNGSYPNDREARAVLSAQFYGRKEYSHVMPWTNDPATATDVRNRLFDFLSIPRATVRFQTGLNAIDLERGMVIELGSDWDSYVPFPCLNTNGSWAGKPLMVTSVSRSGSDFVVGATDVRAVGTGGY